MNSLELHAILENALRGTKTKFLGVFPSNGLPIPTSYPACFVANLDPAPLPGSHWCAFYYVDPNTLEFFDSFGLAPSILPFALPEGLGITYNSTPIQKTTSAVCGHYCIFFLFHRSRGSSLSRIASHLCQIRSDTYVRIYIRKLISALHLQHHPHTSFNHTLLVK